MASAFPTSLPASKTDYDSNDLVASADQNQQGEDINAIAAKVGADSSAVTTSHDYKLSGVTGTDKAVSKTGTETLTNKTLTNPIINGTGEGLPPTSGTALSSGHATRIKSGTNAVLDMGSNSSNGFWLQSTDQTDLSTEYSLLLNPNGGNVIGPFTLAEGQMINGKIYPTVSSNNLTVTLQTMNGSTPSATNPVYVRIGDTIRTITGAVSMTRNAGTNYCNAGSAELATKEIDYFVYLVWNTNENPDGVTLMCARVPYARLYSDLNTGSAVAENSALTAVGITATDEVVVVGRFAATLSAGAGYTWTVPTYTSINLIQRPIYETRLSPVLSPTLAYTGGTTSPGTPDYNCMFYKIIGRRVFVDGWIYKASCEVGADRTTMTINLPLSASTTVSTLHRVYSTGTNTNGSTRTITNVYVADGGAVINIYGLSMTGAAAWQLEYSFSYEI